MRDELGVELSELPRQLLDCSEDELRDKYVIMLGTKLENWCARLVANELETWFMVGEDSVESPDAGPDGLYFTDAPINLFKMIDPQLDVALRDNSGKRAFMLALIEQCAATLRNYSAGITEGLQQVKATYFGGNQLERPEFLFELMVAAANNNSRAKKFVENLVEDRFVAHFDAESADLESLTAALRDIARSFLMAGILNTQIILEIVLADLQEVFGQFFVPKWFDHTCPTRRRKA